MYFNSFEGHLTHFHMPLHPLVNHSQGQLLTSTQRFFEAGLASTTRATYAAGIRRYTSFCKATKLRILPTYESTLILFVAHLATGSVSQATIKVYLSAIRHMHILWGMHNN